jgi:hypothetical protein
VDVVGCIIGLLQRLDLLLVLLLQGCQRSLLVGSSTLQGGSMLSCLLLQLLGQGLVGTPHLGVADSTCLQLALQLVHTCLQRLQQLLLLLCCLLGLTLALLVLVTGGIRLTCPCCCLPLSCGSCPRLGGSRLLRCSCQLCLLLLQAQLHAVGLLLGVVQLALQALDAPRCCLLPVTGCCGLLLPRSCLLPGFCCCQAARLLAAPLAASILAAPLAWAPPLLPHL